MPRGSELYTHTCQALLRAARMGHITRPPPPVPANYDGKNVDEDEDAAGELDTAFAVPKWTQVPQNLEGPEPEFLAERRKGLPSLYGGAPGAMGPLGQSGQMRKTKVRKWDAEGNMNVWDVLVPVGQAVEGEVVEDEVPSTDAPAPGTVVEGVGVANAEGVVIAGEPVVPTPPRRRPPPPKRKAKGPGRGKKKKVAFSAGAGTNGTSNGGNTGAGAMEGVERIKKEGTEDGLANGDVEMGDDSLLQDGEEGSEEDDDEGEEGEDGDKEEGELSPSPGTNAPLSVSPAPFEPPPPQTSEAASIEQKRESQVPPDTPLAQPATTRTYVTQPSPTYSRTTIPEPPEPAPQSSAMDLDRDLSSSPDLPLAAASAAQTTTQILTPSIPAPQTVLSPPPPTLAPIPSPPVIQIDPADEAPLQPAQHLDQTNLSQSMAQIPPENQLSVAEPPRPPSPPAAAAAVASVPLPVIAHAELPAEHDPLDGLAAPRVVVAEEGGEEKVDDGFVEAERESMPRADEAEVDLFGSLERHLDGSGSGSRSGSRSGNADVSRGSLT